MSLCGNLSWACINSPVAPFPVRDEISGKFMLLIARLKGSRGEEELLSKPAFQLSSQGYERLPKNVREGEERHCFPIFLPFRGREKQEEKFSK